jgi:hypothetical protein
MKSSKARLTKLEQHRTEQEGRAGIAFRLPRVNPDLQDWSRRVQQADNTATHKKKEKTNERKI